MSDAEFVQESWIFCCCSLLKQVIILNLLGYSLEEGQRLVKRNGKSYARELRENKPALWAIFSILRAKKTCLPNVFL